jgi:hypothetical protein
MSRASSFAKIADTSDLCSCPAGTCNGMSALGACGALRIVWGREDPWDGKQVGFARAMGRSQLLQTHFQGRL